LLVFVWLIDCYDVSMNTSSLRIGIGHDTHRLKLGGPLRIGGIDVPHDCSLVGHSDADVLLHAVTDALLGAAALGDIGEMFPDTASDNAGRDSGELLQLAAREVQSAGFEIVNLDCIIFAQAPKLSAYKRPIATRIAELLEITPEQVGVKAKTGEGIGPVGEGQVIQAECVVLLTRN